MNNYEVYSKGYSDGYSDALRDKTIDEFFEIEDLPDTDFTVPDPWYKKLLRGLLYGKKK